MRVRERLDPMLFLEGTTPGQKPPLPDQGHRQAGTRVLRGLPQLVPFQPPHEVLGDAGVKRPVAAAEDVDEGQSDQPLDLADDIRAFIKENDRRLKSKL